MDENLKKMLQMAEQIRDATKVGENTAVRVGTELYDIVIQLSQMVGMIDSKLENDAVVAIVKRELASVVITESQLADGCVTASKLAEGAVKNRNLSYGCVRSDNIQSGAINSSHLTENCVSTGNIQDGSVTYKKLSAGIYNDMAKHVAEIVADDFPPHIENEDIDKITNNNN